MPPFPRRKSNFLGDCEEVRQVYGVLNRFVTYRRPGSFLVDTFPSLASIPLFNYLSSWQKVGAEIHKRDSEVFLSFWNQMRKEIEAGTAPHSFGRDFVQSNYRAQGLDELDAAYTAWDPLDISCPCFSVFLVFLFPFLPLSLQSTQFLPPSTPHFSIYPLSTSSVRDIISQLTIAAP